MRHRFMRSMIITPLLGIAAASAINMYVKNRTNQGQTNPNNPSGVNNSMNMTSANGSGIE